MSSYILGKESFEKMLEVTMDLIIKNEGMLIGNQYEQIKSAYDKEQIEKVLRYIKEQVFYLAKTNIVSVRRQYKDIATMADFDILASIDNFQYKHKLKEVNYFSQFLGLFNLYKCLGYQIEIEYNKDFVHKVQHAILNVLAEIQGDICEDVNTWDYIEYLV